MKCLKNNKVCSEQNKICKNCKLDNPRLTNSIINNYEKKIAKRKLEQIINELPNECKNCNFIQIIDLRKKKVYCPYRIKDKCIIK